MNKYTSPLFLSSESLTAFLLLFCSCSLTDSYTNQKWWQSILPERAVKSQPFSVKSFGHNPAGQSLIRLCETREEGWMCDNVMNVLSDYSEHISCLSFMGLAQEQLQGWVHQRKKTEAELTCMDTHRSCHGHFCAVIIGFQGYMWM